MQYENAINQKINLKSTILNHYQQTCGTNHIDNLQLLCKACHKQKSKHEQEDGEYVRIIETESSYNDQVKKIMQDPMSFSYAFIESLNSAINKSLQKITILI